jgi:hypothetical protein
MPYALCPMPMSTSLYFLPLCPLRPLRFNHSGTAGFDLTHPGESTTFPNTLAQQLLGYIIWEKLYSIYQKDEV